jgi:rod shape-determining protein MreB
MLKYFISKAMGARAFRKPRISICVPSGITEIERKAVEEATYQAGARAVYMVEEPIAAAIGAGIDVSKPFGNMVVDIGGGTTDIAVLSLGGVVVSESIKIAGDRFDEAIMRYVRRKYNVLIGERTAELIKKHIGAVYDHPEPKYVEVKGRCMNQGLPKLITISSKEMIEALAEPVTAILDAICLVIEKTPPQLASDVFDGGVTLTGGGALLYGLAEAIGSVLNIPCRVAEDARDCVVVGCAKVLTDPSGMRHLLTV